MSAERPCRFAGLAMLLVLAACGSTEPSKPNGLTILTGGGGTDSIDAALPVALRVEVRDPAGGLRSGAKVVFRGNPLDATLHSYDVLVSAVDFIRWVPSAEATTDANGRAEVRVRLGLRAGSTTLNLTVPDLRLSQTVTYTVTPGSAARIRLTPGDSTVAVGGSYQVDAVVTDRGGNARQDPVTLAATGPELGVAGMQITGRQAGRGAFIARAGSVTSSFCRRLAPT